MSDPNAKVSCAGHGESYATFVCQHLPREYKQGFFHAEDTDDPYPDAWCGKCDRVLMENGGQWNDISEAFAKIGILCANCYVTARKNNELRKKEVDSIFSTIHGDGWELLDAIEENKVYPDTFILPEKESLDRLRGGDHVKLVFAFPVQNDQRKFEIQGERMWVQIDKIATDHFQGRLISQPAYSDRLSPLDKIYFSREHIVAMLHPSFVERVGTLCFLYFNRLFNRKTPSFYRTVPSSHHDPSDTSNRM